MVPYGSTQSERTLMARALALLFAAGASLVLVTLALPHAADADELGLTIPPLIAYAVAATLVALGPRANVRTLQGFLVGGSGLITLCVLYGGAGATVYPPLYVLVSSYAFFFSRARRRSRSAPVPRGAVAVLAVAWTSPRRSLPERTRSAALRFAAEASLALDRAEQAAHDRRRQALEINDNIVQGLVMAKYTAQRGGVEAATRAIDDTLTRARRLISDQLAEVVSGRGIRPGDLARAEAAGVGHDGAADPGGPTRSPPPGSPR